jgi:hypothetical protein
MVRGQSEAAAISSLSVRRKKGALRSRILKEISRGGALKSIEKQAGIKIEKHLHSRN